MRCPRVFGSSSVERSGVVPDRPLCERTSPVEPAPSLHIIGHVGQRDRGFGPCEADGADHQLHRPLLLGERVLDRGAYG